MKLIYRPEDPADGDPGEWDVDIHGMRQSVAEKLEHDFGGTIDEFEQAVITGLSRARRLLLWHVMKFEHPHLRLAQVPDFRTGDLDVELDVDELKRTRERVAANAGLSDYERTKILALVDGEIAEKSEGATVIQGVVVQVGKAPSKLSATPTGESS